MNMRRNIKYMRMIPKQNDKATYLYYWRLESNRIKRGNALLMVSTRSIPGPAFSESDNLRDTSNSGHTTGKRSDISSGLESLVEVS